MQIGPLCDNIMLARNKDRPARGAERRGARQDRIEDRQDRREHDRRYFGPVAMAAIGSKSARLLLNFEAGYE